MYYQVESYEIVGFQPFLRNRNDNFIWFSIIEWNDFFIPLFLSTLKSISSLWSAIGFVRLEKKLNNVPNSMKLRVTQASEGLRKPMTHSQTNSFLKEPLDRKSDCREQRLSLTEGWRCVYVPAPRTTTGVFIQWCYLSNDSHTM